MGFALVDGGNAVPARLSPGIVPGLVSRTLNAEGNPDFIVAPGAGAISSAASFDQWYKDVPGTNTACTFNLTLNETAPGSCSLDSLGLTGA